jgi:hypothetical protein
MSVGCLTGLYIVKYAILLISLSLSPIVVKDAEKMLAHFLQTRLDWEPSLP